MSGSRHMRALLLVTATLLLPAITSAQSPTVISGVVKSETQSPVRGAFVQIVTLQLSAVTNDNGFYRLTIPAARATGQVTISVSSIGFKATERQVALRPGAITQDFVMGEQAVSLDEVVVTGTAGRQDRRAQPAVVTSISAGKVAEVSPIQSVANLLQARTPGVVLRNRSGTSGTATTIRIRGQSSINLSNDPLVFIDGIRADGGTRSLNVSTQNGSPLNDIKIEDIETIEVVKGPAAATLYGSDANAGVINIITKRGRQNSGFTQSLTVEYGQADPNITPPDNYGRCSQSNLTSASTPACAGKTVGTILTDNPLLREGSFSDAVSRSLSWSLRGGGDKFSVFLSASGDNESGTLPNNQYGHLTSRANFDFFVNEKLRLEFGFGLMRINTKLPHNDNDIYGYLGGGLLGDPRTVGAAKDGWYGINRHTEQLSAVENVDHTMRLQPRFSVNYQPVSWFTNRFTAGADMQRGRFWELWPKNVEGWFDDAPRNTGRITETRRAEDRFTFDYLGTVTRSLTSDIRADVSFGSQAIMTVTDNTSATGTGLVNNTVRTVSSAAQLTGGGQDNSQNRQIGFLAQTQFSWRDKLFIQAGARVDQSSAFGADSKPFYSPKIGASYVISDEPFFRNHVSENLVSALRVRAAYGSTGRSPNSGARSTFNPTTNQISATSVAVGVTPDDVGNPLIRAEKGQELEVGFEAGMLRDRLGLDVTFFNKKTIDLILSKPIAPSLGSASPDVNIGAMRNRGWEASANGRILTMQNLALEMRASFNTLDNKILDLGGTPATVTRREDYPVEGEWDYTIKSVDLANNRVIVSNDFEFVGNDVTLPKWETTLSSTLTVLKNLSFYAQLDGRGGVALFNSTDEFRDRQFGISAAAILGCAAFGTNPDGTCTDAARTKYMRRFGPWVTEDGRTLPRADVSGDYYEDAGFFKLREASVSYRVPRNFASRYMHAQAAQFTVSMRNIQTWTDFTGLDPETTQFLTAPADRRWIARFNVTF